MNKFDFSPEALDRGLTEDEVLDFHVKVDDFKDQVDRTQLAEGSAEELRVLHNQWLAIGVELFQVATKAIGARAVRETPPSVKEGMAKTLLSLITGVFSKFRKGE